MQRFKGVGASPGIAIGPAFPLAVSIAVSERGIARDEVASEISRLDRALKATDEQLERLQQHLAERNRGAGHDIVEAHRLMLKSSELVEEARRLVREEHVGGEWAVRRTLDRLRAAFAALADPYFRERGSDVEALGERLLRTLLGMPEPRPGEGAPSGAIAVGTELSPLDPFQLKRAGLVGIATEGGGRTSHAAILARALGLPYVVGVQHLSGRIRPGDLLIVDGTHGEVIVAPDPETRHAFESIAAADAARAQRLTSTRSLAAVTTDGVSVHLAANVECFPEIAAALDLGAESLGLFRTEFLYLERADLPTEEEQYLDAVAVVRALAGRPVTFRTLDLGGDKPPPSIEPRRGPNPALGVRSIRFSLAYQDVFRTQLRALYRASAIGPIRILFPLISGVTELSQARAICREVCAELAAEGQAHDPETPVGAMIETPSAALTVDHLARESDFFSIGTNDLIQYAFAADRENQDVGHLYHPLHPAVLRSLKQIVDAARTANKPLSLCGDMAGDPAFTWVLLGLGLRDLSMTPRQIPLVKAVVRASSFREAEDLAARALELGSELEVERLVLGVMTDRFGGEIEGFPIVTEAPEPPRLEPMRA
jgi:phosphoenolpyruvate-protein phosphotransferase (PTS system enzyme I)